MFEFRRQPLKALYILYTVITVPSVRVPYWIITSILPAWRPRKRWTLYRTLNVYALQAAVKFVFATGAFTGDAPEKSQRNADKLGFVWVEPLPAELVRGDVTEAALVNDVSPAQVHGYWVGKGVGNGSHARKAKSGEKVLYHFHGGGFVFGSSHPNDQHNCQVTALVKECSSTFERAFSLDYRLSSAAPFVQANPFPAALLDTLSGYRYLVETVGFQPHNIVVCGDSAGGQLALSLTRYLIRESIPSLPPPGALVLVSPSVDWACTDLGNPSCSTRANASSDFLAPLFENGYIVRCLLGSLPYEEIHNNAWFSPASLRISTNGLFEKFPPTCIIAGGAEQLVDGIRVLRDRLIADNGKEKIVYWEYPDATHDFLMTTYHEPERSEAQKGLAEWFDGVFECKTSSN
ncbi:hypothetical protein HYDPIDRAFT_33178 [Hydnomerulius pinastri MD-312]|uniref:Alpha/beta hydrolase fold-3 domain-containing protein n=1 Tax=Hydnomerulius pinastri MD-312 TaxID=994086 RepID=A0A0C9W8R8_9AGAM|nr:hypothetical protein HYDPIDRAFT_33178 [Hydnomerulius pinastri MD-312]